MDRETWIVVVNWNGASLLPSCLDALASQTCAARVIVVDNGSTDRSAAIVAARPSVTWLPLGRNLGFAAASNVGMRRALAAGAQNVALVNPDVVLERGWVACMSRAAEAHPESGLFNGLLLFADDPGRVNSTGLEFDRYGRARDRDFGLPLAALRRDDGPVGGITGGAALLRAEALRRVGLFDPGYFAYYEDADLSLRAARAGIGARYVAAARGLHGYGRSFGPGSPLQRFLLARNHLRLVAAHAPPARALSLSLAVPLARALVGAPLEAMRGRPALALAQLRGAAEGAAGALVSLARRWAGRRVPPGAEPGSPERDLGSPDL